MSYRGGLITIKVKETSVLQTASLSVLEGYFDDSGFVLRDKQKNRVLGHVIEVYGITIDEMMPFLGFTPHDKAE